MCAWPLGGPRGLAVAAPESVQWHLSPCDSLDPSRPPGRSALSGSSDWFSCLRADKVMLTTTRKMARRGIRKAGIQCRSS